MTQTVNIIGAGPGGLAAAMLLAHAGLRVRVLERQSTPGGRTSTIETTEGFRFDLGPTFFLYPRVLADIFEACGRRLEDEVEMVRLDPQYRIAFGGGGELLATPSFDEQYDTLVEHYHGMLELYGRDVGAKIARKHLGWYTKGMHGSAEFRNRVNFVDNVSEVLDELERFYEPFLHRRAA